MGELANMVFGPGDHTCLDHWKPLPCPICTERMNKAVSEFKQRWEELHMSWSASVSNVPRRDAVAKLRDNFAATCSSIPTDEVKEQFDAAVRCLETALTTVQPDLDGFVTVSASGHANPGHIPARGWSNDSFTVSVFHVVETL